MVECSPATRAARVRFPDDAKQFLTCRNDISQSVKKKFGGAGYRSRYLSHAKRALYHLSYAPSIHSGEELRGVDLFTWSDIYAQGQPGTSCGYTPKVFPDATNKPSIAQLVERWTVVVLHQKSIGRWFKSGSKDVYGGAQCFKGNRLFPFNLPYSHPFLDSLVVRISACHVEGPGSIPGWGGFIFQTYDICP